MAGDSKRVLYSDEKLNCNKRLLLLCKILHANDEVNPNLKDRIYTRIAMFIQAGVCFAECFDITAGCRSPIVLLTLNLEPQDPFCAVAIGIEIGRVRRDLFKIAAA